MILVFYQLRGVAQHSKNLTGGLYLLNMGLQVRFYFILQNCLCSSALWQHETLRNVKVE